MAVTTSELDALSELLWNARVARAPCAPLSESHPALTIEAAYQVSRANFARRLREPGVRLVGRKIGLTSAAVQKQLGVDQPDFGYLTSDMELESGAAAAAGAWIQPKVEGEVAFRLGRDLKGPGVTAELARAATDGVSAAIEIIDSRVRDWKIRIQDTIADNASSAAFVLGPSRLLADVDLPRAKMRLHKNGTLASGGQGTACLGDPVNAVVWLANALAGFGEGLKAGDLVLSGAYGPVVAFAGGDRCEVEIEGLGRVACSYGA